VLTPSDPSIVEAKRALRERMRATRAAIAGDARARAGAQAAARLGQLVAARGDRLVALYASAGDELPTSAAHATLRALGATICYPRMGTAAPALEFCVVEGPEALVPGALGIAWPHPTLAVVPLNQIKIFVVPGLAFDARGGRLGWGKGHYDRTLLGAPGGYRVGLGFAAQLVEIVPTDERDAALDCVITETGVVATGARPLV
jgi:5-formyltetrahydrofolate cyclo-ligase